MQDPLNLLIVGCGMASGKLIEEILKRDATRFHITVMGDEPEGNYDRIRLTAILQGKTVDRFLLHTKEWFDANSVDAYLGETAIAVDIAKKTVTGDKGTCLSYDILVFATGSRALVPKIAGTDLPGVFVLHNIADVHAISSFIENKTRITVMGGGILGLELADALIDMGKSVTVSHLLQDLMEQQLPSHAAAVLEKHLLLQGIRVEKENPITTVSLSGVGALRFTRKDGTSEETDALIINCGIVPNAALARSAGLAVHRGIVVNDRLQTDNDHIFAMGECAEFNGNTAGLLAPVYAEAACLAAILCGNGEVRYQEAPSLTVKLKSRIAAVAMGQINPERGDTTVVYDNPASLIYKRLIIRDNILVGATLVGDDLNADALSGYYASRIPLPKHIESLLFPGVKNAKEVSQAVYWPGNVTVCDCNSVTCDTIRKAYRELGPDVKRISSATRAGQSCGTCLSRLSSIVENTYDAVVVGSGLGGLTAAANLSRHGLRVLVIEQHDKPGGYATCFTREGFTFDASLHNMGSLNGSILRIFENLGLMDEVEYIPYNYFQRVIFPKHDFVIQKGISHFEDYLISNWPTEKDGILALFAEMRNVQKGYLEIEDITFDAETDDVVSPLMVAKYPQFAEWTQTTFGELMSTHIKDPELKAVIGNMWWYFGLPPSEAPALLYSVLGLGYIEYSGGYIKGTSQQLSFALARKVTDGGGKILLNTKVTRILVSSEKVDGVITDNGEMFYSDLVLSNAGSFETFSALVDETVVKKNYRNKIIRQENSLSAVQLYLGLDCKAESLGLKEHSLSAFVSYDHDENMRFILEGAYDKTPFCCMIYSAVDDTAAPPGRCVVNIFSLAHAADWEGLSRSAYEKKKEQVTAAILKKVETYIPHLSKHIVVRELGTPRTMHRYTGHKDGSIYGQALNIYQSGLSRLQAKTPIRGLFLVGSAIYPGGGYSSVINSGYRTAHLILRKKGAMITAGRESVS